MRTLPIVLVVFTWALGSACSDSTSSITALPDMQTDTASVEVADAGIVSMLGSDQEAEAGTMASDPLVVEVTGSNGAPAVRVPVRWTFETGRGQRIGDPDETGTTMWSLTDSAGKASILWEFGVEAGRQTAWAEIMQPQTASMVMEGVGSPAPDTYAARGGKKGGFTGNAKPGKVSQIRLSPSALQMGPAEFADLDVVVLDQHGNEIQGADLNVTSSDVAVAAVEGSSTIRSGAAGSATITARVGKVRGEALVSVASVTTPPDTVPVGDTIPQDTTTAPPLIILTNVAPVGIEGLPYALALEATGGSGSYSWALASGSLPGGVSLNPLSGVLSGTPTSAGVYPFEARVSDGVGAALLPMSIMIQAAPQTAPSFRRNLPGGWTTVSDYGFEDDFDIHQDGVTTQTSLGTSGWTAIDWGQVGGGVFSSPDAGAPYSPGHVLEEVYPPHLSGSGPDKVTRDIGSESKVYISWIVKWDPDFDHNGTSEKLIYFNYDGGGGDFLFQFYYGVEMVYNIREVGGYEALRANQLAPNWAGHGNAPPVNGVWMEYELLFDQTTGTVKWWKDGVLHGEHTGVNFAPVRNIEITATWGGGGDKQGTHSRYTDHFFIAKGS